jgi:two-component system, response regulator RegA
MTETATAAERPADRSLLIVENDKCALQSLAQTMEAFGFTVTTAESVADGLQQIERAGPAFAVVELTFADGHGLALISALKLRRPGTRAIVLTSHGDIATAVEAVKLGAVDYLIKPANANGNDVCAALLGADVSTSDSPAKPMPADRVRWEHIQSIYELCDRNVSETSRRLNMHRRTLQRILARHSPK